MTLITIKKSQYDNKQLQQVQLSTAMKMIKTGTKKDLIDKIRAEPDKKIRTKLKEHLPQFYMCAYYVNDQGAGVENIESHSGLMCFDLDDLEVGQSEQLQYRLLNSCFFPFIRFVFKSPSGGLKFALQTSYSGSDNELHKFCYKRIAEKLKQLGIPAVAIDAQTCNVNRGIYLSHDPDLYYIDTAKVLPLSKTYDEYNERKRIDDDSRTFERALSEYGEVDEEKARATMDAAFNTIVRKMGNGNRHTLIHAVCVSCYERGLTEHDATQYLNRLKSIGHYTESMNTQNKSADSYKSWKQGGGYVKRDFIMVTRETKHKAWSKSIADIFSHAN
ncbi:hypothetical protein ISX50_18025 [Vibrio cyclitrophicus]|nr:BT4734/BF3469 family protein [Vibrio cyclitrophicus]UPR37165.1 hypothetical protein ISX50_18025 [Vibrio cyclitrophicus]